MFNLTPWNRSGNVHVKHGKDFFSSLQDELSNVFDNFFGESQQGPAYYPSSSEGNRTIRLPIDIIESEDTFKIEAELPGLKQEDIDVKINGNYLTIRAEKTASKKDKDENYVRRERYYGTYQRTLTLPETIDTDKAEATFKKGVLWVEFPKREEAIKPAQKLEIRDVT